jgi:cation:H+ antiporter
VPVGVVCAVVAWGGDLGRLVGLILVLLYVAYVGLIWRVEGAPPALGETSEIEEARDRTAVRGVGRRRIGKDLVLILAGVAAMSVGAAALVEGVRHLASADGSQTQLSLTLVGFATAFELVVLAIAASRRGATEVVVAAVVGSFAYNATMTLGAAALARRRGSQTQANCTFPLSSCSARWCSRSPSGGLPVGSIEAAASLCSLVTRSSSLRFL